LAEKGKIPKPFIRDIFTRKETNAKVRKMVVGIPVIADLEKNMIKQKNCNQYSVSVIVTLLITVK
jgi:hypothetical protein